MRYHDPHGSADEARPCGSAPRRAAFSIYLVAVSVVRRIVRAVRLLARDGGLPRPLRWLAALGLAPIPGPFDEAILLVVAAILWLGYRERLRAAWQEALSNV
jgi:hypothetical protein